MTHKYLMISLGLFILEQQAAPLLGRVWKIWQIPKEEGEDEEEEEGKKEEEK